MLPANYVTAWVRVGPRLAPHSYKNTACKLWFETVVGDFSTWNNSDRTLFCELLTLYLQDIFKVALSSDFTSSQVRVNLVWPGGGFESVIPFAKDGVGPAHYPSPALSCCIMKRTSKLGRSGIGRIFLSGTPYAWLTNGLINPTGISAYQNFATQMNQDFFQPLPPHGVVQLSPRLHSLQDNDLTVIDRWEPLVPPTYLYRRRIRVS